MPIKTNPNGLAPASEPSRKRLGVAERERQIVDGAISFFAEHGFAGQLRDLASSIGITHTLLYHYFPTKQALVDRVYAELFETRWQPEWDSLLDDSTLAAEDKFTSFYDDYVNQTLSREFTRIFVFSGLTDHTIIDRYFAMLRAKLFPRLIRETRRHRRSASRAKASVREHELLSGLHGGFFYIAMRRWIYGQTITADRPLDPTEPYDIALIRERVRAYLAASLELPIAKAVVTPSASPQPRSLKKATA